MRIQKQITTTFDPAIADDLRARSEKSGIPVNTILTDAFRFYRGEVEPVINQRRELVISVLPFKVKRAA